MDYFSFSGGQVFPFGGLTATLEVDRDFNISSYLTYNISFAKTPDRMGIITSANSKLSDTGTMYVKLADESGNPLEGIGLNANGLEKEVYTDENGVAVLTDLQTYEKTILNVDTETLLDIALQPKNEEKKLVLRPGTVRTVAIPFIHRGAVEGKLANDDNIRMFGYQVTAFDHAGKEQGMTFADVDGFFILDSIPYGTYKIIVSKDGHELAELQDVKIDDVSVYIQDEIKLDTRAAAFLPKMTAKNSYCSMKKSMNAALTIRNTATMIFRLIFRKPSMNRGEICSQSKLKKLRAIFLPARMLRFLTRSHLYNHTPDI